MFINRAHSCVLILEGLFDLKECEKPELLHVIVWVFCITFIGFVVTSLIIIGNIYFQLMYY